MHRPSVHPKSKRHFKCQHFGHGSNSWRGRLTCAECSQNDHPTENCNTTNFMCPNCQGLQPAYSQCCSCLDDRRGAAANVAGREWVYCIVTKGDTKTSGLATTERGEAGEGESFVTICHVAHGVQYNSWTTCEKFEIEKKIININVTENVWLSTGEQPQAFCGTTSPLRGTCVARVSLNHVERASSSFSCRCSFLRCSFLDTFPEKSQG